MECDLIKKGCEKKGVKQTTRHIQNYCARDIKQISAFRHIKDVIFFQPPMVFSTQTNFRADEPTLLDMLNMQQDWDE